MEERIENVESCPRCAGTHHNLKFMALTNPPVDGPEYWGVCPKKNEPIFGFFEAEDKPIIPDVQAEEHERISEGVTPEDAGVTYEDLKQSR